MSSAPVFRQSLRATTLRATIEASLADRFAGALTPTPQLIRETLSTGIAALDAVLDGGVPRGAITELVGPLGSGRTTAALRTMANAMREGSMCAWVDASDALDPESAAANGVCLEQLLWVRCGVRTGSTDVGSPEMGARLSEQAGWGGVQPQAQGRPGQHPREEVRGLDRAVGELLRQPQQFYGDSASTGRRTEPFSAVRREEQVSSDRVSRSSRSAAARTQLTAPVSTRERVPQPTRGSFAGIGVKPWARLDQALRAADLLLQAGGFAVLVLDLGSIAPADVMRIPLATWFRFRAAAEQGRTVMLALTQASCARSSAGLVVQFAGLVAGGTSKSVLECLRYQAQPLRQRFSPSAQPVVTIDQRPARKPPQATWQLSEYPMCDQAETA